MSTVEIPTDVKDNNTHSIRIQWRGTRDAKPDEIESGRRYLATFGYALYEWEDVDKNGTRVTLHRFVNREGHTVDLFATYYFTRVACGRGEWCASYATNYAVITEDGQASDPEPLCDTHLGMEYRRAARAEREEIKIDITVSEPLRIGQHD